MRSSRPASSGVVDPLDGVCLSKRNRERAKSDLRKAGRAGGSGSPRARAGRPRPTTASERDMPHDDDGIVWHDLDPARAPVWRYSVALTAHYAIQQFFSRLTPTGVAALCFGPRLKRTHKVLCGRRRVICRIFQRANSPRQTNFYAIFISAHVFYTGFLFDPAYISAS